MNLKQNKWKDLFKKKVFPFVLTFVVAAFAVGCSSQLSEEEQAKKAEAQKLAAYAEEEKSTGTRRLTSENLSDAEKTLKIFVKGIQENDVSGVANAIGVPNVFTEDNLYVWVVENGYEPILETSFEDIKVRSQKEGATTLLDVWIDGDIGKEPSKYQVDFISGKWVIVPPAGIAEKYTFIAPSKNLWCNGVSLEEYAISTDDMGYEWTFEIPRFPVLQDSPKFTIKTNLGEFPAKLFQTQNGNQNGNMVLASFSDEDKRKFEQVLTQTMNTAFQMLQSGASKTEMTSVIVSENILMDCFPQDAAAAAEYSENLKLVQNVSIYEDDIQTGFPQEYVYRLAGNDGIILNAKISTNTALGESRRKAAFTLQNFSGTWKIVDISGKNNLNPFVDFGTYNPAW